MDPDDLSRHLADGVAAVSARADLGEVIAGVERRRRRVRRLSIAGAAVLVMAGVGGVVALAARDARTPDRSAAPPAATVEAGAATPVPSADVPSTDAPAAPTPGLGGDDGDLPEDVTVPDVGIPGGPDPALDYLDRTNPIYRRTMPDGLDVEVRLSDVAYGDLFDIEWSAPTGSAAECLGGPAALIGSTDGPRESGSAWIARHWAPLATDRDVAIDEVYVGGEHGVVVVRTQLPAVEAILSGDEVVEDRAPVVDGVALLAIRFADTAGGAPIGGADPEPPSIRFVVDPAAGAATETGAYPLWGGQLPDDPGDPCVPGPRPGLALPEPGEQPADPAAADAAIRARHALLVDRSIAAEDRPEGLVDDDTGIADAVEQMEAGQYAESAAAAVYTIEEVVFTDPATAWFMYSIDAPTGVFAGRFGQATFDGEVWQITRQTICQDLSLASGHCDGPDRPTPVLRPVSDAEYEELWNDWARGNDAYWRSLNCNPITAC